MTDTLTRRSYLLARVTADGQPVSTVRAEQLLAGSPWATYGRNTARKDLRALASRGFLRPERTADGRRIYHPIPGEDSI